MPAGATANVRLALEGISITDQSSRRKSELKRLGARCSRATWTGNGALMAQAVRKSRSKSLSRTPLRRPTRRKLPSRIPAPQLSAAVRRCRGKFRRYFRRGFYEPLYLDWERGYKWEAHQRWEASLNAQVLGQLIETGKFTEIVKRAVAF